MASSKRKVRCHYEVLEVERDADDGALKKAYRKKALKYHPDKNPDNVEESTQLFREVQQAYDVLTDPQERAWYDKHRDVILAGGSSEFEDGALDLGQYFSTSSYSGYNDGERGFFTVYAEVFATLTKEEAPFDSDAEASEDEDGAADNGEAKYTIGKIPQFGSSTAPYDECVGAFYNYWSNFSTKRSFVWFEKHDTREGPDRRTRRLMEAENKKLRDDGRKKRSEAVRTLVDWLKRHDPRVKARIQHNKELEAERQKRDKERKREQTLLRNQELESFKEAEWSSMATLQSQLDSVEKSMLAEFGDSDDGAEAIAAAIAGAGAGSMDGVDGDRAVNSDDVYEYVQDELYCIACDKSFSSQKTLESHQRSRKHKDSVARLRRELEEDDVDCDMDASIADVLTQLAREDEAESAAAAACGSSKKSKKAKKKKKRLAAAAAASDSGTDDELAAAACGEATLSEEPATAPSLEVNDDTACDGESPSSVVAAPAKAGDGKNAAGSKSQSSSKTSSELDLVCVSCHEVFSSRNKMFQHLKETGHAEPLNRAVSASSSSSKKKGKKGKKRKT